MTPTDRLFGFRHAFDHAMTLWITVGIVSVLVVAAIVIALLSITGKVGPDMKRELWKRTISWMIMVPFIVGPLLLGAGFFMAAVFILALACLREFARATGLFRERLVCIVAALGICLTFFAVADHWYGLFTAAFPMSVGFIAAVSIFQDRPSGYLQRVALGMMAYILFGAALGHLAYMGNAANYRPIVLIFLVGVQMNDVFAFCTGKLFGRRKLAPNTSPGKTIAGAVGAVLLTAPIVAILAHFVFLGTRLDQPLFLGMLGMITSIAGQLGDLMLSSIKRDLGIKDMGAVIPGHGGILDRANSVLLAAPAFFHFVGYLVGFGLDQPTRLITGP